MSWLTATGGACGCDRACRFSLPVCLDSSAWQLCVQLFASASNTHASLTLHAMYVGQLCMPMEPHDVV